MYDWKADAEAHERKATVFKEAGMYKECMQALMYAMWCRDRKCWRCGNGYSNEDGCTCSYE